VASSRSARDLPDVDGRAAAAVDGHAEVRAKVGDSHRASVGSTLAASAKKRYSSAAFFITSNRSSAFLRAFAPSRARSCASRRRRSIASASALASPGSTSRPFSSWSTISGMPATRVEMTDSRRPSPLQHRQERVAVLVQRHDSREDKDGGSLVVRHQLLLRTEAG
jgi:hypothetical protein